MLPLFLEQGLHVAQRVDCLFDLFTRKISCVPGLDELRFDPLT